MLIRFSDDYLKYTNGLSELTIKGSSLGEVLETLLADYPQLYIHWMDNEAYEGKKSSLYLNDEFIWDSTEILRPVEDTDILSISKNVPSGSGAVGKIIAGVVLIVIAVVMWWNPAGWAAFAGAVGTFGAMSTATMMVMAMGVSLALSGIAEMIMGQPSLPSLGDFGSSGSNTPTYSFQGIRNTTTVGTPLGLVYGEHRIGGQLLNIYTDLDGLTNYLYAQIGLCEGEIESISSIEINKNPLSFYAAVELSSVLGTSDQEVMPWFNRTENSVALNTPINADSIPYQTSKIVDAVKLTVSAATLYYSSTTLGLESTTVSFDVYYKPYDSPDYIFHSSHTMAGKTKSETLKEILIDNLGSTTIYDVRVIRTTEDHSGNLDYGDSIVLKNINEINYDTFSYPCTAILGLKIRANDQISGSMPTVTSLVRGTKVLIPNNYDPIAKTYSSVTWDGTFAETKQWTDNPVWCLYDLLTNTRYGLGDYYKLNPAKLSIIKAQFYMMARYCDELVAGVPVYVMTPVNNSDGSITYTNVLTPVVEPRHTLNIVIDSSKNALEWVQTITSAMQANLYYSEGMLWLDINRPKPITHLFNMSNIISGSYAQAGTSYKRIPNSYEVQWPNPDKHYEYSLFRVEHLDLQANDIQIEERKAAMNLVGVTRYSHARRLAKFALLAGRENKKMVTFKTAANALQCMVTDVIGIQHDVPQWGYGSRVVSYDELTRELTLSSDLEFNATSNYEIQIAHKGQSPVTYDITVNSNDPRKVILSSLPDPIPEKDDIYIIGETDFSVKPFKILSLKLTDDAEIEVSATEYNESIYTAAEDITDQEQVVVHNYSSLQSPTKVSVKDFVAEERIYIANDGTIKTGIDCFYTPQSSTLYWDSAVIHYSVEGTGNWQQLPPNKTGNVFIPDLLESTEYKVVAVSSYRDGSRQTLDQALSSADRPFANVTLLGKTAPPSFVHNFVTSQSVNNNNYGKFAWKPVGDIDLSHYEIRIGSALLDGSVVVGYVNDLKDLSTFSILQSDKYQVVNNYWEQGTVVKDYIKETYYNEFFIPVSAPYYFMIKAVDTSGNYSTLPAINYLVTEVEPGTVSGFISKQVGNSIYLIWNANNELDILGYTIREGVSWEASMDIAVNTPNTNFTYSGIHNGTYRFWIKATDIYGAKSKTPTSSICTVVNVPLTNVIMEFNESDPPASLPPLTGTAWPGFKDKVSVSGSTLTLDPLLKYDTGITYDSGLLYDFTTLGTGMYYSPTYDLGHIINANIIFDYSVIIGDGDIFKIEIATSDGTIASWDSEATWDSATAWDDIYEFSDWSLFTGGYITARYIKLRLTLMNASNTLAVSSFKTMVDVPDVTQRGTVLVPASPPEGAVVTFQTSYFYPPTISLSVIGVEGYPRITSKSNNNFTIQVYNNAGETIGGYVDWIANGY